MTQYCVFAHTHVCVSVYACLCLTPCASLWCACKNVRFFLPNPCTLNMRRCLCGSFYAHCELFIIQTLLSPSSSLSPFFLFFFFFSLLHPEQRFTQAVMAVCWAREESDTQVSQLLWHFWTIEWWSVTIAFRGCYLFWFWREKNFCPRMTFSVSCFWGFLFSLVLEKNLFALEWCSVSVPFRVHYLFWFWKKPFALEWRSVSIPFRVHCLGSGKKTFCPRMTFSVNSF